MKKGILSNVIIGVNNCKVLYKLYTYSDSFYLCDYI